METKKTLKIEFRIEQWDKKVIELRARQLNISISEYCRRCALNRELPLPPSEKQMDAYLLLQQYRGYFSRIGNMFMHRDFSSLLLEVEEVKNKISEHLKRIENGGTRSIN